MKNINANTPEAGKNNNTGRILLIILCCVLALILAVLLTVTIYAQHMLNKIERADATTAPSLSADEIYDIENPVPDEDNTAPTVNPEDVEWADEPEISIGGDNIVNILLIGQDRREGEGRARSDAMILCTFNKEKNSITLTSFLRDLYVQIPGGYMDNRINSSYMLGGMDLLNETITHNFGVEIDGNVEVDFSQFANIIDLLGGVDVELTQEEADFLYENGNWGVSDTAYQWNLKAGMNHLTGEQATAYSRIRYIGNGDFGRTDRQRTVLYALTEAYKNASTTKMLTLLDDILPMITTDMTNSEIIGYATSLFPMLASAEIQTQRIPGDDAFYGASIRGMSVLVPDLEMCRQQLVDSLQ